MAGVFNNQIINSVLYSCDDWRAQYSNNQFIIIMVSLKQLAGSMFK